MPRQICCALTQEKRILFGSGDIWKDVEADEATLHHALLRLCVCRSCLMDLGSDKASSRMMYERGASAVGIPATSPKMV